MSDASATSRVTFAHHPWSNREALPLSDGASATFVKKMVRRLAQASHAVGRDDTVDRATVTDVLGEAAENRNRICRRIIGLSDTSSRARGAGAPPLDGRCEELRLTTD